MQKLQKLNLIQLQSLRVGQQYQIMTSYVQLYLRKNHLYHSGESVLLAMTGTKPFSVNPPLIFRSLALT